MGISARKVNNYDLYSGHAWYVPGIKGMFGFSASSAGSSSVPSLAAS